VKCKLHTAGDVGMLLLMKWKYNAIFLCCYS